MAERRSERLRRAVPPDPVSTKRNRGRGASARSAASRNEEVRHAQPRKRRLWPWLVVAGIILFVAVFVASAVWNHWYRYDDAADMQGEWKLAAAGSTVIIDEKTIRLTQDVSYTYVIDDHDKTLTFKFGANTGTAKYHFSSDRQTLVIREDGTEDFMVDWGFATDPAIAADTLEDATTVLVRISDSTERSPQDLTEHSTEEADSLGAAIVSGEATNQEGAQSDRSQPSDRADAEDSEESDSEATTDAA